MTMASTLWKMCRIEHMLLPCRFKFKRANFKIRSDVRHAHQPRDTRKEVSRITKQKYPSYILLNHFIHPFDDSLTNDFVLNLMLGYIFVSIQYRLITTNLID